MASDDTFYKQIVETLAFEGGYSDDPADPGGETNFGISKAAYPDVDIADLTQDQAIAIYKADYWHAPRIDQLPDTIAGKVFDMGVNMGPATAVRILQDCLNTWSNPKLVIDGRIGPHTIDAATKEAVGDWLLNDYRKAVADHYMAIIRNTPSLARFQRGWLRRAQA